MLLRSTLLYVPAILITRVCALLFVIIATRIVDQTEYGLLTLVVAVGEMIDIIVNDWLRISLLRLGGKGEVSRGSIARAGGILTISMLVAFAVSVPASFLVVPERWWEFALALCIYLVSGAVARLSLVVLQMQQRHSAYVALEFLRAALQLAFPLLTMLTAHNSFLAVSVASSLGTLVAGLVAGAVAGRAMIKGPSRFTRKEFLQLGLPIIAVALVSLGLNNAERVILNAYHGAAPVAVFAAIYALARQPISMIANAVNTGSFPEAVARFDEKGQKAAADFFTQIMALILSLSLPAAALISALGSDVVALVLPPDYGGAHAELFLIITLSVVCTSLTDYVYGAMLHAHKRPQLMIYNKLAGSVVGIGLSVALIPSLAEMGAALGLAGGAVGSLIVCIMINSRMTPIAFPWTSLASAVAISLGTAGAASLAAHFLQPAIVIIRLVGSGAVGGLAFLMLNALLHRRAAIEQLTAIRARFAARRAAPPA